MTILSIISIMVYVITAVYLLYLLKYPLNRLKCFFREVRRLTIFNMARKERGLSDEEARVFVESLYPCTEEDLEYRRGKVIKIVRRDARDKRLELNKLTYLTEDQLLRKISADNS